jgi:hypothetical protein
VEKYTRIEIIHEDQLIDPKCRFTLIKKEKKDAGEHAGEDGQHGFHDDDARAAREAAAEG